MIGRVVVDVRRTGRRFDAEATLELPADARTVWETVTDYEALPDFMPGISACRIVERGRVGAAGERLVVEQRGEFRFLVFAQAMDVRLHIQHERRRVAEARAVSFDLGVLEGRAIDLFVGRYELEPPASRPAKSAEARTLLRYTAQIGLRLPPPPGIGHVALKQNLSTQLGALADEIVRRTKR